MENSFWYPLLMENGDYYGKKLLRPAFTSWFFSILVHLFANRYFERFGEPTPIGRAPFDEEVDMPVPSGGTRKVRGNEYLLNVLQQLRNRSVVVLPNDRTQMKEGTFEYDYDIEYLESQMRGADFERYLTRLDEEISLGLFTPILLLRTADVGSYNLGVGHMQVYLWMLNAMNDDRAQYINKYILSKFTNYNFSPNAPRPKIVFRKMGNTDVDLIKQLLVALVSGDKAKPDLDELGKLAGLTLKQVRQTTEPPALPGDTGDTGDTGNSPDSSGSSAENLASVRSVVADIKARVQPQIENAFREERLSDLKVNLGYKRRFSKALAIEGVANFEEVANEFYGHLDTWLRDVIALGQDEFSGPESFMAMFQKVVAVELDRISA
jgi:hypothetical protein